MHLLRAVSLVLVVAAAVPTAHAALPALPVPAENPITEEKRVLGKILFWEEQLSSDDTMACGTCHKPAHASSDPRVGRHPGLDGLFHTDDDTFGSPGVRRADASGAYYPDPIFGLEPQVTRRRAPEILANQYARNLFWDGAASETFIDPETGQTSIVEDGSLENQAVRPILSDVEMAREGRTWDDVRDKLEAVTPLALATNLPGDVADAILAHSDYPALFASAFGDPAITAERIAFAIATYERTLLPDQTPWDAFVDGDANALTQSQQDGLFVFGSKTCVICHVPPVFTDRTFRNIGLRPIAEDIGRFGVTGNPPDRGRFKVPTLRNLGLKPRFMHTGHLMTVADVVDFYFELNGQVHFPDNQDPFVSDLSILPEQIAPLIDFLSNGLTDPRVAAETFPFDRPTLGSEVSASIVATMPPSPHPYFGAAPNPFRPSTVLHYETRVDGPVRVRIYDARGRMVRRLVDTWQTSGARRVVWDGTSDDGSDVAAGVYFYRLQTARTSATTRLVRVR